jgi:MYXO-CTERM domain-containing protein
MIRAANQVALRAHVLGAPVGMLAGLLALLVPFTAQASGPISINFVGKYTSAMGPAEQAGVEPQTCWNNVDSMVGTLTGLLDAQGVVTSAAVEWRGDPDYNGLTESPGDNRMMRGYLQNLPGEDLSVEVTGLGPHPYDLILYFDGNNGSTAWQMTYAVSGIQRTVTDPPGFTDPVVFTEDTGAGGNWTRIVGLSGDAFTLEAWSPSGHSGLLNGLQIVPMPEPGTLALLALGVAGLWRPRRRTRNPAAHSG